MSSGTRLNASRGRPWWPLVLLALSLAAAPPLLEFSQTAGQAPAPPAFVDTPIQHINNLRPKYYFLGNSMLNSRIDASHFRRVAETRAISQPKNGVMSAAWYLQIKNHLAVASHRVDRVFIFFRDTNLTEPRRRTEGRYAKILESLRRVHEPELDAVVSGSPVHRVPYLGRALHILDDSAERFYGMPAAVRRWKDAPVLFALNLAAGGEPAEARRLRNLQNDVFSARRARSVADAGRKGGTLAHAYDFDVALKRSLLPAMLRIGREAELKLCFVRVKTRRAAAGGPEDPRLARYIDRLRSYLESRDNCLIDMNREPAVKYAWYAHGDHIARQHRRAYTEVFYRRMQTVIDVL